MMARRDWGTGSIYRRKDGRWMATLEAGYTKAGARRRVTVSASTEAAVKRKLRDRRLQIEREGLPAASGRLTVKRWAEQWADVTVTALRPKAYASNSSALKQWIVPTIGHRRLDELTPGDMRAVATAQRKAGRSGTTALRTHWTLMSMLKAARADGHAVPPRVFDVTAPTKAVSDRDALSVDECLLVIAVADQLLPHAARWIVALLYGLRQGECLGLTWDAIDFGTDSEAGTFAVEWQLQPLPYLDKTDHAKGFRVPDGYESRHLVDAYHLTRPKSVKGRRVVPLLPSVRRELLAWRQVAPENPWGLVWPTVDGRPANSKADLAEWHGLQQTALVGHEAGRPYHLHEARHSAASLLGALGVPEHVIISILGHSSFLSSQAYLHARQDDSRAGLMQAARVLGRELEGPG